MLPPYLKKDFRLSRRCCGIGAWAEGPGALRGCAGRHQSAVSGIWGRGIAEIIFHFSLAAHLQVKAVSSRSEPQEALPEADLVGVPP